MINVDEFIRNSSGIGLTDDVLHEFYFGIIHISHESHQAAPNWDKVIGIHERVLWKVLRTLGDRNLAVYKDADEGDVTMFINSISDEIRLRSEHPNRTDRDFRHYLQILLRDRIKFLEAALDITPDDIAHFKSGSSWTKWLLAGGAAIAVIGIIGKTVSHQSDKKTGKEKK